MDHCLYQAQGEEMDQTSYPVNCILDGVSFQLAAPEDFGWLKKYGTVFKVWDQQSSGNLCFGVDGPWGKLFIKYAGAHTLRFEGDPAEAVYTLQQAMPLYEVRHLALVKLLAHGPVNGGYAAVFAWQDGFVLREGPGGENKAQLQALPLWHVLSMLDGIIDLHVQLAEMGYVAVDFYDGNLLVNPQTGQMVLCDADLYRKKPALNDRGRMFGSARFMAPEEFERGASITESTTVFNLAALAFEIFGDNMDRRKKRWRGPLPLYEVAARATAEKPMERYATILAFQSAWRHAVSQLNL